MRRIQTLGIVITAATVATLSGPAIASADTEFTGQTYADAQQAISHAGMTSRVGSIVGGEQPTDQCTVTGSQTRQVVGSSGFSGGSEVVLDLDCGTAGATGSAQSQQAAADAEQSKNQSLLEQQGTPEQAGADVQTGN